MGDRAEVTSLLGSGVDPHLYTPSRNDVLMIKEADLVVYSGLMLEGRMQDALKSAAKSKPVIAAGDLIDHQKLIMASGTHPDPHAWTDVSMWQEMTILLAEKLGEIDPENSVYYQENAEAYAAQLAALHQYGVEGAKTLPVNMRVLVTAHDAFAYFGRAYGLDVLAVQGISTEAEAGLSDINTLVSTLVERKIPAVFFESSVPQKNVEALIEGARNSGHDLQIGGELFSDAMGPMGTYEGTYIGMMDHNLTIVIRSLGGDVPIGGFQGKLNEVGS